MLGHFKAIFVSIVTLLFASSLFAEQPTIADNPTATIETSMGAFKVELFEDKAPITVKNFIEYAQSGHYNGTIFHRVIPNFMVQGGGLDVDMKELPTNPPIKNEASNGLQNNVGTLAMARTMKVDSATSQFFINTNNNYFLNHGVRDYGYAVFGKVIDGMNVIMAIQEVETDTKQMHQDVPVEPIYINKVTISQK